MSVLCSAKQSRLVMMAGRMMPSKAHKGTIYCRIGFGSKSIKEQSAERGIRMPQQRTIRKGRVYFLIFLFFCLCGVVLFGGMKVYRKLQEPLEQDQIADQTAAQLQIEHSRQIEEIRNGHASGIVKVSGFSDEELRSLFYSRDLDETMIKKITGVTYSPEQGFITPNDLQYVRVLYTNYDGKTCIGELIVHQALAKEVEEIFYDLYLHQYPIGRMVLPDAYGGDESASMSANDTYAMNFRLLSGIRQDDFSMGTALYLNPLYNPNVTQINGVLSVTPRGAYSYAGRGFIKDHMITKDDYACKVFLDHGWTWGGTDKDDVSYGLFYKPYDSLHSSAPAANEETRTEEQPSETQDDPSAPADPAALDSPAQQPPAALEQNPSDPAAGQTPQPEQTIDPATGLPIPNQPAQPNDPNNPAAPSDPNASSAPAAPADPADPSAPAPAPEVPADPSQGVIDETIGQPVAPLQPAADPAAVQPGENPADPAAAVPAA